MKFRRSILLFIAGVVLVAYFTKPSKDRFMETVQQTSGNGQPPVVAYQDKFLYTTVTATYVDISNPIRENDRLVAPARKETYIGVFGRYWKQNQ